MADPSHPAPFSDPILDRMRLILADEIKRLDTNTLVVLDPFAGTGRVHELSGIFLDRSIIVTHGVEIEPEWADLHPRTQVGDATALPPAWTSMFDVVATSPTYGNRMADHHEAKDDSIRMTYRHKLGRALSVNNTGKLQWGDEYRNMHLKAWNEVSRVLKPEGMIILNCSNHIRKHKEIEVTEWHIDTLCKMGYNVERHDRVPTRRMRYGSNNNVRVPYEHVVCLRKEPR